MLLEQVNQFRLGLAIGRVPQEVARLIVRESQVAGPHLREQSVSTELDQRQERIDAGREYEPKSRRRVLQERGEEFVDLGIVDRVIVVQYQDHIVRQRKQLVAELGREVGS
jgi:hypothetical protein